MALLKNIWKSAADANIPAPGNLPEEDVAALFKAVEANDLPALKAVLDTGLPVDTRNDAGETPLMLAAHRHFTLMLHELLDRKADPNAQSTEGNTPLCYAANIGHWDMFTVLAQNGAQISGKNPKEFLALNAALLRAIEEKDNEALIALQGAGVKDAEALRAKVFKLVAEGDWGRVEGCLNHGVPPNLRDAQGNTLLMKAIEAGSGKVVDILVEAGADRDAKNKAGQTALSIAKGKNDFATVASLLAGGATAGIVMNADELKEALCSAVVGGRAQMVERLLKQGASAQPAGSGSLLSLAVENNHYDIAITLLKAGADVLAPSANDQYKLGVAIVKSGDLDAVKRFLDPIVASGNNHTSLGVHRDFNLLHVAAGMRDPSVARMIGQCVPKLINRKENWGSTPLRVALEHQNLPMVQALLDLGADPRISGKSPDTVEMSDWDYADKHCSDNAVAEMVATSGNKFQLMEAGARGDLAAVQQAMEAGVPPDLTDGEGTTVLYHACLRGNTEIVRTLVSHGANVSLPCRDGETPMSAALGNGEGEPEIVRILGDAGASVMTPGRNGLAPVAYLEKPLADNLSTGMRDAISYCRDLDIVRMAQQATHLEKKTTVFKSLKFKNASQPAFEATEPGATTLPPQLMETPTGPVDDKPSMFRGLRFKVPAAP